MCPRQSTDNLDLFSWRGDTQQDQATAPISEAHAPVEQKSKAAAIEPLSVSAVNALARKSLEGQFSRVMVVGEISNYKSVASGRHYFTLKDSQAQLPVALFRREATRLATPLRHGMEVVVTGRLTLYERSGRYQIIADRVEARGAGALQAAVEALKQRLMQEGIFAAAHKRPLPLVPRTVVVITSPTGAVIRDIINVGTRRFPGIRILLIPSEVQGENAPKSLCTALERLNQLVREGRHKIDVAIIGRGGGSLEDLWAFNHEDVVRAISASSVPVVSSVGHETDTTLADLVADVRAPTPSAAAELVFPRCDQLLEGIHKQQTRSIQALRGIIRQSRLRLSAAERHLGDGQGPLLKGRQRLEQALQFIAHHTRELLSTQRLRVNRQETRLAASHPQARLQLLHQRIHTSHAICGKIIVRALTHERQRMSAVTQRLTPAMQNLVQRDAQRLAGLGRSLDALSPLKVLERGYSIARTTEGEVIRSVGEEGKGGRQIKVGDEIDIWPRKGRLRARITEVDADECLVSNLPVEK